MLSNEAMGTYFKVLFQHSGTMWEDHGELFVNSNGAMNLYFRHLPCCVRVRVVDGPITEHI